MNQNGHGENGAFVGVGVGVGGGLGGVGGGGLGDGDPVLKIFVPARQQPF